MSERIPNYEERYCAFIDILGFRNLVDGIQRASDAGPLRDVMQKIHAPTSDSTVNRDIDFRAQSISDAIAISTTTFGLYRIFESIEKLAVDLLREGYFVRGALVSGPLYHDSSMVFGKALVRAYELETTIARYRRVIISKQVVENIKAMGRGTFLPTRKNDLTLSSSKPMTDLTMYMYCARWQLR